MAEIVRVTIHADGKVWPVRLIFRSRLLAWLPIGGLVSSRGTARFKRDRREIPLWLVGHELVHCRQAARLGWRYVPLHTWVNLTARFRKMWHWMEVEAEGLCRRWATNGQAWDGPAYPVPRSWHAPAK